MTIVKPVILVVIDGFGYSESTAGNAVALAQKPTLNYFQQNFPHTLLQTSGPAVGLEWGESGNSEVGHLSLGAGRIVKQYPSIINESINRGGFFQNPTLVKTLLAIGKGGGKLHLAGLLTSGSVHAYFKHLIALIEMAQKFTIPQIFLHLFLDGKDSGPKEGLALLRKLKSQIDSVSVRVATLIGRNFAMERNNDWEKTRQTYELITEGAGRQVADWETAISEHYQNGLTDENFPPSVLKDLTCPLLAPSDGLIFFNFREDSMRQISHAFVDPDFSFFKRKDKYKIFLVSLTRYFDTPFMPHVFEPVLIKNNLAEWLSVQGLKQLHIAESEKYAHVTLFFNGLSDRVFEGETDFFLPSPPDLASNPAMKSQEIAQKVIEELRRGYYQFYLVNFANADLIAHLGNINLVAKGIEYVDSALGQIYEEAKKQDAVLIVTSDHGNSETLTYGTSGEKETRHNISPVPFCLVGSQFEKRSLPFEVSGILPDVAPTVLEILNIAPPAEMTGRSLLKLLIPSI